MAKLSNVQRIIAEDYPKGDQETISKLAYILNNALEQLVAMFNKGITVTDNLNEDIIDVTVTVGADGTPTSPTQFKYSLVGTCKGVMVINVANLTNTAISPTGAPFVVFQVGNGGLIQITKVLGLPANNNFRLTLRVVGSG